MRGTDTLIDREAAASLIRWWRDAGVDTLVEDEARDWLAARNPLPIGDGVAEQREAGKGGVWESAPPPVHFVAAPLPGAEMVELPATLDTLLAWMRESGEVPEARWGRTRILPSGDPQAGLMILIDAPDQADAEAGVLLTGELGVLFDKMLAAIGRTRESIWLASFATVRAIGRVPADATNRLSQIARHHIRLVAPRRLLIMGDVPSRALLGTEVASARGQLHRLDHGAGVVETVATFHPRLLDKSPEFKRQAWKDLQLLTGAL